ncbi:MAG: hypothetical protein PF495_04890, partial [Spirochaetales bacterium]|nr:hypothetical protein [Spirochaetales bacterium]
MMKKTSVTALSILMGLFLISGCDPQQSYGSRSEDPSYELFIIHNLAETIGYIDLDDNTYHNADAQKRVFPAGSSPNQLVADKTKGRLYSINSTSNSI